MRQNKSKPLSPSVNLSSIFGRELTLNPRPSFANYGWLPKNPVKLDFLTGSPLTVAGELPIFCNQSLITTETNSLFEQANLEIPRNLLVYQTETEYRDLLNSFQSRRGTLVCNHLHPDDELDQEAYWIDPVLLAYLNNKGNLHKIAPASQVPLRLIVPPADVKKMGSKIIKFPLVIKAAVDQSTGGGFDVAICQRKEDLEQACSQFRLCPTLVVEEYIDAEKIYNVQFAKTFDQRLIYLGTSEQICDPDGRYLGNWITSEGSGPPQSVIELGREIMNAACWLGFFGVAGFDIAMSKDRRALAIDLNFRLNGSTPALLLKDSIRLKSNASVLLFRTWQAALSWDRFLSICTDLVVGGDLIPISVYNSPTSPYPGSLPLISGILVGRSKQEVLTKERQLSKLGLK